MATNYNYFGGIVTNGLVLDLDAAKLASYPGTGTTWYDISGNNLSGSLINGPTFSGIGKQAAIVFDGVDDYVNIASSGSQIPNLQACTLNCFIKFSNFSKAYSIISETSGSLGFLSNYQFSPLVKSNGKLAFYVFNTTSNQSSYDGTGIFTLSTNTWYMLTFVYQGSTRQEGYVNGVLDNSVGSPVASIAPSSNNYLIGASIFGDRYPSMQLSQFCMYSRALSQTEITQNFNALRGRYGI